MKIFCIHGVSHEEKDNAFRPAWEAAIRGALLAAGEAMEPSFAYLEYDALFAKSGANFNDYAEAGLRLLASGIGGLFTGGAGTRGLGEVGSTVRWTAGMVAQWVADETLRADLRKLLATRLAAEEPDLVCAHSLGTLIAYDTFTQSPAPMAGRKLITFGSQIANPAVRGDVFGGRIVPISGIGHWYHLYNRNDHVFTAPIRLDDASFTQVQTPFDKPNDLLNHDAAFYLGHPATVADVWRRVFTPPSKSRALGEKVFDAALRGGNAGRGKRAAAPAPNRKALLIGINQYPDPAARLEGCVNDVFRMSATLQESGFAPDEIRVVLDSRATAEGIVERLHWLLDDTRAGDERFLFYSGHGAQMPSLNPRGESDRMDECLCPVDFDWTAAHAITDKQFRELYTQLPYDARFIAMFDCCHSGGMTRDGGRPRGLTPPDDIRHRALRWDADSQMWVPREWVSAQKEAARVAADKNTVTNARGMSRLGCATGLRGHDDKHYDAARKAYGHQGPYLPVLLYACRESQLAAEYRHGVTSYGAFTYCLSEMLGAERRRGRNLSFAKLMEGVQARIKDLGYVQTPQWVGPKAVLQADIPWAAAPRRTARRG
ncbi:hypothetical protein GCM10025771_15680 [Niveibacterium umoris]|uniref:Peptidase C14 caspase domain-containing protein n=1 Tax=Niveibacterium umoris TaxID=1193620 RepID=A0A840BLX7_9RHOO|nr:caspase family protein [Niveibacterium umoris]MBB4014561.1 hypothetical protein [Niveibacterium umoris]